MIFGWCHNDLEDFRRRRESNFYFYEVIGIDILTNFFLMLDIMINKLE